MHRVGLPVAATVQTPVLALSGRVLDGADAAQSGEGGVAVEAIVADCQTLPVAL